MRILFVAPEAYPLMKTGGLGDVAGGLPAALDGLGEDVRILIPAFPDAVKALAERRTRPWQSRMSGGVRARLIEGRMPDSGVKVLLLDCPPLFDRPGSPYLGPDGRDWPDNHRRFGLLGRVAASVAQGRAGLDWQPDLVHANDWQCGLAPAYLALDGLPHPPVVFTIHNIAFQGNFPPHVMPELGLPPACFSMHGVEYYGQLSFLKAGLYYAQSLITVSPTYAREIQTPAFGCGLEGLLAARAAEGRLAGLLNGVDYSQWDPSADIHLAHPYRPADVKGKARNKHALQIDFGLARDADCPLFIIISRLTGQKGIDLVQAAIPGLVSRGAQLAVIGTGEAVFERGLTDLAQAYPRQVAVRIGYDEALAHRLQAGGDILLMPSRFEPCGLTQLYAMRYATLPLVRAVGGLADTVIDAAPEAVAAGRATGFRFTETTVSGLLAAIDRAIALFRRKDQWRRVQLAAIAQDFSWHSAAQAYRYYFESLGPTPKPAETPDLRSRARPRPAAKAKAAAKLKAGQGTARARLIEA